MTLTIGEQICDFLLAACKSGGQGLIFLHLKYFLLVHRILDSRFRGPDHVIGGLTTLDHVVAFGFSVFKGPELSDLSI